MLSYVAVAVIVITMKRNTPVSRRVANVALIVLLAQLGQVGLATLAALPLLAKAAARRLTGGVVARPVATLARLAP